MRYIYAIIVLVLIAISFSFGMSLGKQNSSTTTCEVGCKAEQVMLDQCLTAVEYYKEQLETGISEDCPKTAVEVLGKNFCGSRAKNIRYDNDNKSVIIVTCYDGRILNFTEV